MANKNYYKEIIIVLAELKKEHPTYNMGKHLATATVDYGDVWSISDKELLNSLVKYRNTLLFDTQPETSIEAIIADGESLSLEPSEEEDY
jgi:hypothetical protein